MDGHPFLPRGTTLQVWGENYHGHPFLPRSTEYGPLGWGGTIIDILYFQGVRPFRFGGSHHGHSLLPSGTTL